MANKLPPKTIRFGCKVIQVKLDPVTSFPVLYTTNGIIIKAKVILQFCFLNLRMAILDKEDESMFTSSFIMSS